MVTIKRVGVGSAMKVGALLYALSFTVFGIFIIALQSAALTTFSNIISQQSPRGTIPSGSAIAGGGLVFFCIFYAAGVIFCLIAGGIGGAVTAILYNLIANWVGGLELQLSASGMSPPEKSKMVEVGTGQSPPPF